MWVEEKPYDPFGRNRHYQATEKIMEVSVSQGFSKLGFPKVHRGNG
jgi:hypothetical protein